MPRFATPVFSDFASLAFAVGLFAAGTAAPAIAMNSPDSREAQGTTSITLSLHAGNHTIVLDYFNLAGDAEVGLSWTRVPGFRRAGPASRVQPSGNKAQRTGHER